MKLFSFFFGASLVLAIKGQATDCDYDYICDDAVSPEDLVMSAPSPLACYQACKTYNEDATNQANGDTCDHWTYYEEMGFGREFDEENDTEVDIVDGKLRRRGKPVCRRLTSCAKRFSKSGCESSVGGVKCASGPGSCEACDMCTKLTGGVTAVAARWFCNINEPYKRTTIPPGTICRTECGSNTWFDGTQNGPFFAEATCRSTCNDPTPGTEGEWVVTPNGATDGTDPLSPVKDSDCLCEEIVLEPYQIPSVTGQTTDENALFYCNPPLVDGTNADTIEETMDSSSQCQLFCHGKLYLDIACDAGVWTGGVTTNEEINCFSFPPVCDYQDWASPNTCKCPDATDPPVFTVCSADQACLSDGSCLDVCIQSATPIPGPDSCFCEDAFGGGASCNAGQTCDGGTCT